MVKRKPHTITVENQIKDTTGDGDTASKLGAGTPASFRANVQPAKTEAIFAKFGVETKSAIVAFMEVADAQAVHHRAKVTWNAQDYEVIAPPEIHDQGGNTDYGKIYCRSVTVG